MSRATRRQKLEIELEELEREFVVLLLEALSRCASGEWGMFGQNDAILQGLPPRLQARLKSDVSEKLLQLGDEITAIRATLGIRESFEPHAMYLRYRQRKSSNDLGEPRLAALFLAELNKG